MKTVRIFLIILCLTQSPAAVARTPITPVEAMHLVEHLLDRGAIAPMEISLVQRDGEEIYLFEGIAGTDGICATVDAHCARVIELKLNGKPFYRWPGVIVVAHRGASKFAPENTLPAFERAIELGADLIEMDVRQTRDGELILMHDETVDRTTDGSGAVEQLTLAQIRALDAGSWFGDAFRGVRVPTLRQALAAIRGQARPDIDFKAGDPEKLVQVLDEGGALDNTTLYSGDWELLQLTFELSGKFLIRPTLPGGLWGLPELLNHLDPPIVNINWEQFTERAVREVHLAGKKSFLNSMQNDTDTVILEMASTRPDYLQSDHLDRLIAVLRAKGWHK